MAFPLGALSSLTGDLIKDTLFSGRSSWGKGCWHAQAWSPRKEAAHSSDAGPRSRPAAGRGAVMWMLFLKRARRCQKGPRHCPSVNRAQRTRSTVSALGELTASPTFLSGRCHPRWRSSLAPHGSVREGTAISILEVFRIGLEIMGETWTEGLPLPSSVPWANYITSPDLSFFSETG